MSNIFSSTVTAQVLRVLLSSRKYKTVYLLLTNFKVGIQNHIPVTVTDSLLFLEFYGDTSDTPDIEVIIQTYPTYFHFKDEVLPLQA
jgi:hypothetical protein